MDHAAVRHGAVGLDDGAQIGVLRVRRLRRAAGSRRRSARGLPSTCVEPSAARSTLKTDCTSVPVAAFGRSSGTDCDTMIFAVTMKMMRRTSVMSTSGVTLIPVIALVRVVSLRRRPSARLSLELVAPARRRARAVPWSARRLVRRLRRLCAGALVRAASDFRCARSTWPSASVFASVVFTMRWNVLNATTAGMATSEADGRRDERLGDVRS